MWWIISSHAILISLSHTIASCSGFIFASLLYLWPWSKTSCDIQGCNKHQSLSIYWSYLVLWTLYVCDMWNAVCYMHCGTFHNNQNLHIFLSIHVLCSILLFVLPYKKIWSTCSQEPVMFLRRYQWTWPSKQNIFSCDSFHTSPSVKKAIVPWQKCWNVRSYPDTYIWIILIHITSD
jgi:hypothetical protein